MESTHDPGAKFARVTAWRGDHAAIVSQTVNYINLLARYEDTGLMPEEITRMAKGQKAEKNEPLTREQLLNMDGQPVWIEFIPDFDGEQLKMWALVSVDQDDGEVFLLNSIGGSSAYEEVWSDIQAIYRHPPKRPAI